MPRKWVTKIDTRAMKYFLEIAAGKTYWDVAESYNISQSSVSKAIQKLENELGVKLFDRSKRFVSLTHVGSIFFDALRPLEQEFQRALEQISPYSSKSKVSCSIVPNLDFLDLRLKIQQRNFLEATPHLELTLEDQMDPVQAVLDLKAEKVDFVIGHQFAITAPFCDSIPVLQDTFYVVLPKDHSLSGQTHIDLQEVYNEPFLIRSLVIKEALRESCEAIGRPMPPNCHIFNMPASQLRRDHIISRVAFGHGITIYFESDLYPFKLDNVYSCPLTGCPAFPVMLSWKKGKKLGPAQQAFRDCLCQQIFHVSPTTRGSASD